METKMETKYDLIENSFYWIKLEFDWVIGRYNNNLFQITTGEFIGFNRIVEVDYKQILK
jgi:hypothetical protein